MGWLLNQESIHFEVFLKTSACKAYKSSHEEVFSKIGVLKIQTSHNGLRMKFRQNSWETYDGVHL